MDAKRAEALRAWARDFRARNPARTEIPLPYTPTEPTEPSAPKPTKIEFGSELARMIAEKNRRDTRIKKLKGIITRLKKKHTKAEADLNAMGSLSASEKRLNMRYKRLELACAGAAQSLAEAERELVALKEMSG